MRAVTLLLLVVVLLHDADSEGPSSTIDCAASGLLWSGLCGCQGAYFLMVLSPGPFELRDLLLTSFRRTSRVLQCRAKLICHWSTC